MVLQMQLIAIAIGAFKKFAEIYYFNIMWHKYYLFLQTLRKKTPIILVINSALWLRSFYYLGTYT